MFRALLVALLCCLSAARADVFQPSVAWSTFLAGGADTVRIGLDSRGNIYLFTNIDSGSSRQNDLYVAKLSPDATQILWQRFIGGSAQDFASYLAVSPSGDVFLSGTTNSLDFPVTRNALPVVFQPADATRTTAYLMHLDSNGATQYSTLVEGYAGAILPEADGELWFTGASTSPMLAATPGALALGGDAYIARLSADGSRILISLHGVTGSLLARDPAGNLIVAGVASGPQLAVPGTDIHVTPGSFQTTIINSQCGGFFVFPCSHQFVSKVSADGSRLLFSTYVSGYNDSPQAMAVDPDGNILLAGNTQTPDYPSTPGTVQPVFGGQVTYGPHGGIESANGYVTKLAADGGSLLWSTFLGSNSTGFVSDLKVATDGNVYIAANLNIRDFPQLGAAGKCNPGPIVAGIRADGTAFVSARAFPVAFGYPSSGLIRGELALDGKGSLVFASAPVQPTFPVNPQTVSINPDPAHIPNGAMIAKLDLTRAGSPAELACLADGADLQTRVSIAPGELITLFAESGLGAPQPAAASPEAGRYPTAVAGTQVLFDDIPAPLLYTAPDQINTVAPYEIAGRTSTVISVVQDGVTVHQRVVPVVPRAPAFLMAVGNFGLQCTINGDTLTGRPVVGGVILNPDGTQNSCASPARPGDTVEVFLTGLGAVSAAPPDGVIYNEPAPSFPLPLQIQINGKDASIDSITGAAGWISGVWRVRAKIPPDIAFSVAQFTATIDGIASQPQTFFAWVQR